MNKIPFDPTNPDIEVVREIVFARLKQEADWQQLDQMGRDFEPYVEYVGRSDPGLLAFLSQEVFWQLVIEGILSPGMNSSNMNLPWFHRTKYGKQVIEKEVPTPHDPTGYLTRISQNVRKPDQTVLFYLSESLFSFRRGNLVASTVMLGIAAERVFLLVCESMLNALQNAAEKQKLERILMRFPMKPKLDWIHNKVQYLQECRLPGFPENGTLMLTTIYDLIRNQRNELGHPREIPPTMRREDAYVNLQVFSSYYVTAEEIRDFLSSNKV